MLRPHQTVEELADHETPETYATGVFDDQELIAVGLIGPTGEPGEWRVRGMATAPQARGRGAGTAVLAGLVDYAVERGARRIWANVRIAARTLYERAGFSVISEEFELPMIGAHVVMELWVDEGGPGTDVGGGTVA